uniref:Uncharacterized protein n=1 Tax=Bactrocera latifrons TaxID=174628 RepID=A0A0K8U728_BACLA
MAKRTAWNGNVSNINKIEMTDHAALIEKGKRRSQLEKVIRNIYAYRRKLREEAANIDSDKENYDSVVNAKRRNKRHHRSRYARKCARPLKLRGQSNPKSFLFYYKKKNFNRSRKVGRGYLNEARKLVESDIRIENFSLNQTVERFHRNAKSLLRDIMRLRHRARFALLDTLECLEMLHGNNGVKKN